MIQSIQKVIKVGSSAAVTIPAKTMKQENVSVGDEVEIIIRPLVQKKSKNNSSESEAVSAAKSVLKQYKQDFKNLSQR